MAAFKVLPEVARIKLAAGWIALLYFSLASLKPAKHGVDFIWQFLQWLVPLGCYGTSEKPHHSRKRR